MFINGIEVTCKSGDVKKAMQRFADAIREAYIEQMVKEKMDSLIKATNQPSESKSEIYDYFKEGR